MERTIFRLIGIVHGDGSLSGNRLTITDKCHEFPIVLRKIFQKHFSYVPPIFRDAKRNTFYTYTKQKEIVKFLFRDI